MIRTQTGHAPALPFATALGAPLGALSNLASLGAIWHRRIRPAVRWGAWTATCSPTSA